MFVQAPADTGLHQLNAVLVGAPGARRELPPALQARATASQALLRILVVPNDNNAQTQLPQQLPPLPSFLNNLTTPPDTSVSLVFSETGNVPTGDVANPPSFYLGLASNPQVKFNPSVPLIRMPLGATQMWKVTNQSLRLNHPFHIHVNPFQVLYVSYQPSDGNAPFYAQLNAAASAGRPLWMDTFALPKGGYIVIRQRYDDFTGRFVMHCHILGHEERGMMQLVEIIR
jgi:FtsP/CotA-like multicopper oxidase with cupredoxin domain